MLGIAWSPIETRYEARRKRYRQIEVKPQHLLQLECTRCWRAILQEGGGSQLLDLRKTQREVGLHIISEAMGT